MDVNFTTVAIGSAIFGAFANILARTLLKKVKAKNILGINFLTMAVTLALISPAFYMFNATPYAIFLVVLIGFIDTIANYFYFKTFEKVEASVATPMLSLAPAFTFLFGWLFISDTVSLITYFMAALIILAVVAFSVDVKDLRNTKTINLLPALIASVLFGLSAIPARYLLSTIDAINAPTLYMFRAALIALFSLVVFGFPLKGISVSQYRLIFARGLLVISQWLLLYYAITLGNAGVSLTLANITPIFVFVLAALFLKEKITAKKVIASVLILVLSLLI
jgi:drug/metabolite transporter (DMT)-like permease